MKVQHTTYASADTETVKRETVADSDKHNTLKNRLVQYSI